ncbi:MAG: hypothetical protein ACLFR0_07170 [Alphaproteobacteria bacterium]
MKPLFCALLVTATFSPSIAMARNCENPVTKEQVQAAQAEWGQAIVDIGAAENPKEKAKDVIDTLYAYDEGDVLFKPTLASNEPFRGTEEEALSYFTGGKFEEDKGFALAPYTNVRFDSEGIITYCDAAISMGEYYFTKTDGNEIKVEYSFGYMKDDNGDLKINLHHSSLPFSPAE